MTNENTRIQSMIAALDDPNKNVRLDAAMGLGTANSAEGARALVAHLGTETECNVREGLTWATVQAGAAAVPGVIEQLSNPNPNVRMQAAHVLSKIADPAHAEVIIPVIADADPQVAVKAYRAAANTGTAAVVPALAARLGDGDLEQRDALTTAFATLGEIGVAPVIDALSDAEPTVRAHAADTLGHLGSPLADAALPRLAELLTDADADVRLSAVSALRELDADELGAPLTDALEAATGSSDPVVAAIARQPVRSR